MNIQDCIVCSSNLVESFQTSDSLNYWHCNSCGARFLDKKHHIDEDSEKKRYLEHENIIEDEGAGHDCASIQHGVVRLVYNKVFDFQSFQNT